MGGHWSWVRVPDQGSEKVVLADMAATTDCTLYPKSRAEQGRGSGSWGAPETASGVI